MLSFWAALAAASNACIAANFLSCDAFISQGISLEDFVHHALEFDRDWMPTFGFFLDMMLRVNFPMAESLKEPVPV